MGKRGITHTYRSKEYKLSVVKKVLEGKSSREVGKEVGINDSLVRAWVAQYQKNGETALEPKRKPGNPLSRYTRRKELSEIEQLRYELARAELELSKLKKAYAVERRCPKQKK